MWFQHVNLGPTSEYLGDLCTNPHGTWTIAKSLKSRTRQSHRRYWSMWWIQHFSMSTWNRLANI